MPIYAGRRPGTWRVVISVRNKPKEEVVEGSKDDAKLHEARMLIAHRVRSATSQRSGARFSSFCVEEYAPHARLRLASSTWRTRESILARLVEFFGDTPLSVFSTESIDAYAQQQTEAGLRPRYINTDLTVLGAILHWAAKDRGQLVGEFHVRPLRTDVRRVHCWSTAEVDKLLRAARRLDPFFEPMLVFLLNTGVRKNESVAAQWPWIDWRARLVRIPVTDAWRPKSRKPREVPIGDALWHMLRARSRSSPFIFPTPEGEPFKAFPDWRFRAVREEAGVRGSPHSARHTYASHFLQAVPDLGLLAKVLGHSHTRTTEFYAHLLPGHLSHARNAVNLGATVAKKRAS